MGYNIEVSFNLNKNSNVTEIQTMISNLAEKNGCQFSNIDYEYDYISKFKRNHCVITINFQKKDILNFIEFLKKIKNYNFIFIESIYSDNKCKIIYASQYYKSQKVNKTIEKMCKKDKIDLSLSNEEIMILNTIFPTIR